MTSKISVYGFSGFVGSTFCGLYPNDVIEIPREQRKPESNDILYLISTTTNHNMLTDLTIDVDVNLRVLLETLEYCKNNKLTFNYVSTGFVYGSDIIDAKETDFCNPKGFYSITKRTAEQLVTSFCEVNQVNYRILRIANTYGHDKTISSKKNVLGFLINLMRENKDLTLYNNGDDLRDYMHIIDVCRALKTVIDNGELNSVYNIASGNPLPFRKILETVRINLNSKSVFIPIETPIFNQLVIPKNFSLNVDKLKSLGFILSIDLNEGLQSLCN
tara:strand:- start:2240 stop:3061 length:822 start_codon:yes stop_codon:yes gene_type:complete